MEALFYQTWKESLNYLTLNTYQYKIINICSGLNELLDVIHSCLVNPLYSTKNVDFCREELLKIVKENEVLDEYFGVLKGSLLNTLSMSPKNTETINAMNYRLSYVYDILDNQYLDKLIEFIQKNIDESNKENVYNYTKELTSVCVYKGFSSTFLYGLIDLCISNPIKILKELKSQITKGIKEFVVFIELDSRDSEELTSITDHLSYYNINSNKSEDIIKDFPELNGKIKKNKLFIKSIEKAKDYSGAAFNAINKIANIFNILSFFSQITPWNKDDLYIIAVNLKTHKYQLLDLKSLYLMDKKARKLKFKEEIKATLKEENDFTKRLKATFSYVNIAKSAMTIEEKYINLWIALESLCRSDIHQYIIDNIVEVVPAALCYMYINDLYKNFLEDIFRTDDDFSLFGLLKDNNRKDNIQQLIKIFNDSTLYSNLENTIGDNNLLKVRLNEIKEIATDDKTFSDHIRNHYQNVYWQLRRLYRIRNKIAHVTGRDDIVLGRYTENLQDYIELFVLHLLNYANHKQIKDIKILLMEIKDNHECFCSLTKHFYEKNGSKKATNDITLKKYANLES